MPNTEVPTPPLGPRATAGCLEATCCIIGGGPAGMMLGLLLARAGVDTVVLEKHADFFRDFRGDTVHPSTMELIDELGALDAFLEIPHQRLSQISIDIDGTVVLGPDLSRLKVRCPFIAFMPQWDFLDFLSDLARPYPGFDLRMNAEAVDLIRDGNRTIGVKAVTPNGPLEVFADLVVGADGRNSKARAAAGLVPAELGVPIDVLWFRLPKQRPEFSTALGRVRNGRMMILIDRGDYYQCGYVIARGGIDALKAGGLDAFRSAVVELAPFVADAVDELTDWDRVKLLTVRIDRLERWHAPGLLCIGDAAHAMSPAGGVGINFAIQDAVAAANILVPRLLDRRVTESDLARVQSRRTWPVSVTQRLQAIAHRRLFGGGPATGPVSPSPLTTLLLRPLAPLLRRLLARVIGVGLRPEHIETPDITPSRG